MKEQVHEQLILELKLNERSNTIFVLSSILLNLVILAVNSGLSQNEDPDKYVLMILFALLMLVYMGISVAGIKKEAESEACSLTGSCSCIATMGWTGIIGRNFWIAMPEDTCCYISPSRPRGL